MKMTNSDTHTSNRQLFNQFSIRTLVFEASSVLTKKYFDSFSVFTANYSYFFQLLTLTCTSGSTLTARLQLDSTELPLGPLVCTLADPHVTKSFSSNY